MDIVVEIFQDLWRFLRVRKKFWLLPMILIFLLLGALALLSHPFVAAPLIYTIQ